MRLKIYVFKLWPNWKVHIRLLRHRLMVIPSLGVSVESFSGYIHTRLVAYEEIE